MALLLLPSPLSFLKLPNNDDDDGNPQEKTKAMALHASHIALYMLVRFLAVLVLTTPGNDQSEVLWTKGAPGDVSSIFFPNICPIHANFISVKLAHFSCRTT